jgi:hypothetical protein
MSLWYLQEDAQHTNTVANTEKKLYLQGIAGGFLCKEHAAAYSLLHVVPASGSDLLMLPTDPNSGGNA